MQDIYMYKGNILNLLTLLSVFCILMKDDDSFFKSYLKFGILQNMQNPVLRNSTSSSLHRPPRRNAFADK